MKLQPNSLCYLGAATLVATLLLYTGTAAAVSFKVLHSFAGGSDGCYPGVGNLILDEGGNLYGTTQGGAGCTYGTVFELSNGLEIILYTFTGGGNGDTPNGLLRDEQGNLYGTTEDGGGSMGCGLVFEVPAVGKEKTLHTFAGPPNDGCTPWASLVSDDRGNFYGTTMGGGASRAGTAFRLGKDGMETLVRSFNETHGGCFPFGGLTQGKRRVLFGTTEHCGSKQGGGTVFELAGDGRETVLYKFKGASPNDARVPDGLIRDALGTFYGTLAEGGVMGCDSGCGAVFKLTPDGKESILHFFTGGSTDGGNPWGGAIVDNAGNLYGTTEYGGGTCAVEGGLGCGTVFKIAPDGTETILYNFSAENGANGSIPLAGLIFDSAGNLYGTTEYGGASGYGNVFEITP